MNGLPNGAAYPLGDLRSIVFHWTAGDYATTYPSYHVCVARDASGMFVARLTADLSSNMRDVRAGEAPYTAHVSGRNSHAIGLAVCAMAGATPHDFGDYPLTDDAIAIACRAAAGLCLAYAIPIDREHVFTHAEAALDDGYFGSGDDERWDIARLRPSARPLRPVDAATAGDELRRRIRESTSDVCIAR